MNITVDVKELQAYAEQLRNWGMLRSAHGREWLEKNFTYSSSSMSRDFNREIFMEVLIQWEKEHLIPTLIPNV